MRTIATICGFRLIRSMHSGVNNHAQALYALNGGRPLAGRPTLGSWLTYGLGSETQELPAYMVLSHPNGLPTFQGEHFTNGWLPSLYQGTLIRPKQPHILNLDPPPALAGEGQRRQLDLLRREWEPLSVSPSRADGIEHGYAMISRFFPGARDELAAIDEEVVKGVLGPPRAGRAECFEEQYASSGGQLYELMIGHDRFNADLRPLLEPLLRARGEPPGLYCHPYDVCTALIAEEAGVIVTAPDGTRLDAPFSVDAPVAWVGYANEKLRARIEPVLRRALDRRGLLPASAT